VVNVDQLVSLVPEDQRKSATSELVPVVDTLSAGYGKVLGKGRLTVDMPLIVKARFVSRAAEAKCVETAARLALTLAGSRPRAASSRLSRERELRCRTTSRLHDVSRPRDWRLATACLCRVCAARLPDALDCTWPSHSYTDAPACVCS